MERGTNIAAFLLAHLFHLLGLKKNVDVKIFYHSATCLHIYEMHESYDPPYLLHLGFYLSFLFSWHVHLFPAFPVSSSACVLSSSHNVLC